VTLESVPVRAIVSNYERRAGQATSRLLHSGIKSTITVEPLGGLGLRARCAQAFPRRALGCRASRCHGTPLCL
jgi:hypothetical protein